MITSVVFKYSKISDYVSIDCYMDGSFIAMFYCPSTDICVEHSQEDNYWLCLTGDKSVSLHISQDVYSQLLQQLSDISSAEILATYDR